MKRNVYAFLFSLFAAVVLAPGQAIAHHSFAAEFDAEKPVTLKGIVVKWEMMNPHGWITVDVTGSAGEKVRWMVETSNPNGLMRLGWTNLGRPKFKCGVQMSTKPNQKEEEWSGDRSLACDANGVDDDRVQ